MSLLGSRRRKLLFGVTVVGLFLAALVGFILVPDSNQDASDQIHLQLVATNNADDATVWFCITNLGKKSILILPRYSGIEAADSWLELPAPAFGPLFLELGPGQCEEIPISFPRDGRLWRGKVLWLEKPTDFQQARWQLREKAGSLFPSLEPDPEAVWNSHVRTSYSKEFKR
jgi:hypothetical protein